MEIAPTFDLETGQHILENGNLKTATDLQNIKQWIDKTLRTQLDKFKIYEAVDYGISIYKYMGKRTLPAGYLNAEFKRELTEQLLKNSYISNVTDYTAVRERRGIIVNFTVVLEDKNVINIKDYKSWEVA